MSKNEPELMPQPGKWSVEKRAEMPVGSVDIESLLSQAVTAKAGVESLERLMVIRRELRAESAKEAYDRAMAEFQAECPSIVKRRKGAGEGAYKYATIDDALAQQLKDGTNRNIKQLIKEKGFSFDIDTDVETGWVKAFITIKHEAGHSEKKSFKVPTDERNKMMSAPQKYGGSLTFSKRYVFFNGFGILTADEDRDAQIPQPAKGPKVATQKTREWFLAEIQPIKDKALCYAIDKAIIMPNEGLDAWPLDKLPTSRQELAPLKQAIERHL